MSKTLSIYLKLNTSCFDLASALLIATPTSSMIGFDSGASLPPIFRVDLLRVGSGSLVPVPCQSEPVMSIPTLHSALLQCWSLSISPVASLFLSVCNSSAGLCQLGNQLGCDGAWEPKCHSSVQGTWTSGTQVSFSYRINFFREIWLYRNWDTSMLSKG